MASNILVDSVAKGEIIAHIHDHGMKETYSWFENKHQDTIKAAKTAYRSKVEKVYSEYRTLSKNKSKPGYTEKYALFRDQIVHFPEAGQPKKRKTDDIDFAKKSMFLQNVETLKDVTQDLSEELFKHKIENESLKEQITVLQRKVKAQQQSRIKLMKRKETQLSKVHMKQEMCLKKLVLKKNEQLKRQRISTSYYESKSKRLIEKKCALSEEIHTLKLKIENETAECFAKTERIKELERELRDITVENEWLRSMCNDVVQTYDKHTGAYTTGTQQCVYSLLEHNVSTSKIPLVIRDVLKLVNIKASHLPCKSTCNNMNVQRLHLAQRQLAEEFSSKENTTLLSDETSKYGQKYEGFHAVDDTGRIWVLGLRQMATKSGQSALDTFNEILSDIEDSFRNAESSVSEEIIINVTATMSDRAATQKKFNDLLEEFRTNILKRKLNWDAMSENEKSSVSRLLNFFCSLHVLVHLAEGAEKALLETEKMLFNDAPIFDATFRKPSESGTTRLIRCSSKAFARGGDDKNGAHGQFQAFIQGYLKENGFLSIPIERFRGNRFNILFSNAAAVFFLSSKFLEYLEGGDTNRLLKAVKFDLLVPEYLAGCRALGLISELITKPIWCLIENSEIGILDMQQYYTELLTYLDTFDTLAFISGRSRLSFTEQEHLDKSKIFQSLVQSTQLDVKVVTVLEIMIPVLRNIMQNLFKDFLPGGQWHECDQALKEKVKGTPKHNKFSETVFGQLDRLLREKPNISILTSEAIISFCHNKTLSWLLAKSDIEREDLCVNARKSTKELRRKFKERQAAIKVEVNRNVEARLEQERQQARKRIQKLENMVNDIQVWGLWQSHQEVDSGLSVLKTKTDKLSALKSQLNFRKHVLKQSTDATTYSFSKKDGDKRVNLTIQELTESVKKLVVEAFTVNENELDPDGPFLVGRKVKQKFKEGEDEIWYIGQVISQVPGYKEWFNIKYAGDAAIYTYKLLTEYKNGDLQILVQ